MTTPLHILADRVEVSEPGSEIDTAIALTLGVAQNRFSTSIDAAMTLVPPCAQGGGRLWAVKLNSGLYGATAELWHESSLKRYHGHAPGSHEAMPSALTAACLRAIAANQENPS